MELNRVYNENCLETMDRMDDGSVDLVVTSPPYDNLRDYDGYSFEFEKTAHSLLRILKEGGVIVWVVGDATIDGSETGTSFKQALYFKEIGLRLHDTMIYEKNAFQKPCKTRYWSMFEYMFILSKGKPKTVNLIVDRRNVGAGEIVRRKTIREMDGKTCSRKSYKTEEYGKRTNIWRYVVGFMKSTVDKFAFEHPAMFPEKLAQDHIKTWSNEGDLVYDPFMGSGTVAKMCLLEKRIFLGSEISEKYCKIAEQRIQNLGVLL